MSGSAEDRPRRLESIDLVRGVIMVLMALDHTRDFFGDLAASPTNLATASPALFLTRWVTHFCAPVFFLLTGAGARLQLRRQSRAELSRFLATRGLWLVLLEVTVMRLILQFNLDYRVTLLTTLWALGWSMVALALLVRLPVRIVAVVSGAMILLHNATDGVAASSFGAFAPLWTVLHAPGFLVSTARQTVFAAYPLIPWIGVMATGFVLAHAYDWEPARRRAVLLRTGAALTVAFIALRALALYGDPQPWTAQATPMLSALSFLNTNKYPPSLLFLLMTLGPALVALALAERGTPAWLRPAVTIGRVPLFYYLAHFLVIHLLAVAASVARFGSAHWMTQSPSLDRFPVTQPPGWPLPITGVWLVWVAVVLLMYPLCRWYAAAKARHPDGPLRYL